MRAAPPSFERVAVVGAGTMGAGIAQVFAQASLTVDVLDSNAEVLERGLASIRARLERQVARGKLAAEAARAILTCLHPVGSVEDLPVPDLVLEAVPERLDLKRSLLADLHRRYPNAVLATNTSTLSISAIAQPVARAEQVIGVHFFNPAPVLPLVEVIPGSETAPRVTEAVMALVKRLGKTPVLAQDTPGFIVNRVARPYYGEALRILLDHGGTEDVARTVDAALVAAGFRMGPFELMDLIGLDVNLASSKSVYESSFHDPRFRPSPIQQRLVDAGRLGRKTGHGFYRYEGQP